MGKLIKYELKGNYKTFCALFAIIILLQGLFLTRIGHWQSGSIIGITVLVNTILFITVLIFVEKSFANEIYEDRGYLTFTLPVSGYKVLGSKIIIGVLWFLISGFISFISFKTIINALSGEDLIKILSSRIDIKQFVLIGIIYAIIVLIMLLLTIYFSITLTRVAYKGKKISGFIGFIVFIVLNFVISYISYKVGDVFPHEMKISLDMVNSLGSTGIINDGTITITPEYFTINIARSIYMLVVYIGMFFGTGYLLENKMNI
ncbi:ABC transporter permease [Clostridium novyi]|uniref:ABC transporter permease n=1 Tax=Clostridium novyi TaxID=1542 RepID=UPI0004D75F27|nr:ABC transporter permease [Clostridium novyi]KEH85033.1 membrane protein [Clostridium novyi A str. 4540]